MRKPTWTKNVTLVFCLVMAFSLTQSVIAAPQTDESNSNKISENSKVRLDSTDTNIDSINLIPVFSGTETPTAAHLIAMQEHFKNLVGKVRPATVGIETGGASGSGVIVSRDGFVLTAAHVIGKPDVDATIILQDGTRLKAKTLGMDHNIDSGMLKIEDDGKWPYLDLGESELLNEGQWVMAIGHPGGFDPERSPPIRVGRILSSNEDVMQTDCTLVGGDSGGPLVDMDGKVIGIHSRIGGFLNQNYHVPVDTFLINWDDLVGKVEKGGRRSTEVDVDMGIQFVDEESLVIKSLTTDGPAEQAGLKPGDELLRLDGRGISSRRSLRRMLIRAKPDSTVKIVVNRGEEELEFDITYGHGGENK